MAYRPPLTDEQRKRIIELHGEGLSRNAIAKEVGVGWASVTKVCGEAGLSFDRSATEQAVQARVTDMKAQRTALAVKYLEDAERLRAGMWTASQESQAVGGQNPTVLRWERDEPCPADKGHLMRASTAAFTSHLKAVEFDAGDGMGAAKALLGDLVEAFGVRVRSRGDDGS